MKCMYCNKEISDYGHNPEDFNLHTPYLDFSDKKTCERCNSLVTITNRLIKNVIDNEGACGSLEILENHVNFLKINYRK